MSLKIAILYGSVRQARNGIRLVLFLRTQLENRGHGVDIIDAREENLAVLDQRLSDYREGSAPENLLRLAERIESADAFVIVSGEYNHTIQPGLTNLIDHFYAEWGHRAAGLVTYSTGGFGGVRAAAHLRNIAGAVGMCVIPSMLTQPHLTKTFDENGKAESEAAENFAAPFLDQLIWYAEAIKAKRDADGLSGKT